MLSSILSLPFRLLLLLAAGLRQAGRWLAHVFSLVLGRVYWRPAPWLKRAAGPFRKAWQWGRSHQISASALIVLLSLAAPASILFYNWYQNRPQPPLADYRVEPPGPTDYINNEGHPEPLGIRFQVPAASLRLSGEELPPGLINLSPAQEGVWRWINDRFLFFAPDKDWIPGQKYQINWQTEEIFARQTRVDNKNAHFTIPNFTIQSAPPAFAQDEQDPRRRRAVFPLIFSHPVDKASLEARISLQLLEKDEPPQTLPHHLTYDESGLKAWVSSEDMDLSEFPRQVRLNLQAMVNSRLGGAGAPSLSASLQLPVLYSLTLNRADCILADNEDYEIDQIISLEFNHRLANEAMQKSLQAFVLPRDHPSQPSAAAPFSWHIPAVDETVMTQVRPLPLQHLDSGQTYSNRHDFKFKAQPGDYILLRLPSGLEAHGGYRLGQDVWRIIKTPPFPAMLRLAGHGSLLSLSGDKRLTIMGRNLDNAYFEIGRLRPGQLHHLANLSHGDWANPSLQISPDCFIDRFQASLSFANQSRPQYQGLDLSPYLEAKGVPRQGDPAAEKRRQASTIYPRETGAPRQGVFLVRLSSDENDLRGDNYSYRDNSPVRDARMVIISDLGLLLKQDQDGGQHVYIQSIQSGQPLSQVRVDLVAINGQAVLSAESGADGHVYFNNLERFTRELRPVMYVAVKDGDSNFLPLNRQGRSLNYSRFDVGGPPAPPDPGQLSAHLFSDRGLYRPGDKINLGFIVRDYAWSRDLSGLPVNLIVSDSQGREMARHPLALAEDGFGEFSLITSPTAATGNWRAAVYLPQEEKQPARFLGETIFQVQEFEPDRLRVEVRLSEKVKTGWIHPQDLDILVKVQNLFGLPAQKRKVEAEFSLQPISPLFTRWSGYRFYDPGLASRPWRNALPAQESDDQGLTGFKIDLGEFRQASFQFSLRVEAFEPDGGRGVSAFSALMVSSRPFMLGLKADGNLDFIARQAKRGLYLLAVDPDLQAVAAENLRLTLIERRFVSVLSRQPSGIYQYESHQKEEILWEKDLNLPASGLEYALPTDKSGRFRLLISDREGTELNRADFVVAGEANLTRSLERNAELELSLDKSSYRPGEEISVAIRAPYPGSGLITIEKDKVYSHAWFKTETSSAVQKITVPAGLEGNAYVNVQFIRDPNSDQIFMSPMSYGAAPFNLDRSPHRASLELSVPELIKPGQQLDIRISGGQGGERAIVFAVDEGILQAAAYQLRDPLDTFMVKRALTVSTAQILDLILPDFKRFLDSAAPGGGDGDDEPELATPQALLARNLNPFARQTEKAVTYWSGLVALDGEKTLQFTVPEYFNGQLRIMAVAAGRQRLGLAQERVVVRDHFILTPHVPVVAAPGDEFMVSLGVARDLEEEENAETGGEQELRVKVEASPNLRIMEGEEQGLTLKAGSEGRINLKVKGLEQPGAAWLDFSVTGGEQRSRRRAGLSLRPPVPYTTEVRSGRLDEGQLSLENLRAMYDQNAIRSLEAAYTPLALARGLDAYLAAYPHQCSEQLSSRGLAHLALLGLINEGAENRRAREDDIKTILETLQGRQNRKGMFGSWYASLQEEPFVSLYVSQFLQEASQAGLLPFPALLERANQYLRDIAQNDYYQDMNGLRLRAWAVYLLTRQSYVTSNYLAQVQARLENNFPRHWRDDLSALYLACAYKLLHKDKEAEELTAGLWARVNQEQALEIPATSGQMYNRLAWRATVIYLMGRHFPAQFKEIKPAALENLILELNGNQINTLAAAMSLQALEAYNRQLSGQDGQLLASQENQDGGGADLAQDVRWLKTDFTGQAVRLILSNRASHPAWYSLIESGFARQVPEKAISQGMEIVREYVDKENNPLSQVSLGQEIRVKIKIRSLNKAYIDHVALIDLLPGGFAPVPGSAGPAAENADSDRSGVYADIREDRVVIYTSAGPETREFSYAARAVSQGDFQIPPVYAEAMYDGQVKASSAGGGIMRINGPETLPLGK